VLLLSDSLKYELGEVSEESDQKQQSAKSCLDSITLETFQLGYCSISFGRDRFLAKLIIPETILQEGKLIDFVEEKSV
jgi:hypothetical protein